jgi:hypothetical protein
LVVYLWRRWHLDAVSAVSDTSQYTNIRGNQIEGKERCFSKLRETEMVLNMSSIALKRCLSSHAYIFCKLFDSLRDSDDETERLPTDTGNERAKFIMTRKVDPALN